MKLDTEFVRLPLRADAARLAAEVAAIAEPDWRPHPEGHPGNSALPLIAVGGDPGNDGTRGPMLPTPYLAHCPYLRQVLAALGTVLGRTRLMRLDGNAEATAHADSNYYWIERARVHVPIVTTPAVRFRCGEREVHMAPGEAWIFDTWRIHNVFNPEPTRRIHLVADTVGSSAFWDLVERGERPFAVPPRPARGELRVAFDAAASPTLRIEGSNFPRLMSPWEQESLLARLRGDWAAAGAGPPEAWRRLEEELQRFQRDWRARWAAEGDGGPAEGWRRLVERLDHALEPLAGQVSCSNGIDAVEMVRQAVVRPALAAPAPRAGRAAAGPRGASASPAVPSGAGQPLFDRPIFIVAPPRSGASLFFETLALAPGTFTLGGEGHAVFDRIPSLGPEQRGFDSNRLLAADADPAVVRSLESLLHDRVRDRYGQPPPAGVRGLRLVEMTPRNALRVPFLARAFPEARFVYVFRDPRATISSAVEVWRSKTFVTYPDLPGWEGEPWSLLLVPGWRELSGRPLEELVARQWQITTRTLLDDLEALPPERWCVASHDDLVERPAEEIARLCHFLGLGWDHELRARTVPAPEPGTAAVVDGVLGKVQAEMERARDLFARRPKVVAAAPPSLPEPAPSTEDLAAAPRPVEDTWAGSPLRSVHTESFPQILSQLGVSLLVSTYQSGRVFVLRAAGPNLNTHFRSFRSPMGLAVGASSLAIGTERHVWMYRNVPAVTRQLQPAGQHDACFLPYRAHVTGDIRLHEMAFAGEELWLVNTRFSCLCTLDAQHSFVPRWRPPFVTALAAEDRCHLNGLAVIDGQPRFVTALGRTDASNGWRADKARGGVVVDVSSGEVAAAGLSMPHSPRWHQGRLWALESGAGTLARVDLDTGRFETVARLPGFTRGLACVGPVAFVGLSQVRETNVFGGLPLTESNEPRVCGVWIVHLETGNVLGFVRFEEGVQEIFDVQVLPGLRFPEIGEPDSDLIAHTFVLPPAALAEVPLPT
jgi:uncharacterized protein (TIGR03032 family)